MTNSKLLPHKYYCYIFYDPKNNYLPIYVGKGINGRVRSHIYKNIQESEKVNPNKWKYFMQLIKNNTPPIYKIFYCETENDAYQLENFLINFWGRKDIDENGILFNIVPGGRTVLSGHERSELTKQKISNKSSLIWDVIFPDGHIERIKNLANFCRKYNLGLGNLRKTFTGELNKHKGFKCSLPNIPENQKHTCKGTKKSKEFKQLISKKSKQINNQENVKLLKSILMLGNDNGKYNKGISKSEEHKNKQSIIMKQKYKNGEIISPLLGKHHSEKSKKKISNSKKGKPLTENQIQGILKTTQKRIGYQHSNNTKIKMASKNNNLSIWEITFPDGQIEQIINLNAFCKTHQLSSGNFTNYGHTKGFKAKKIKKVNS